MSKIENLKTRLHPRNRNRAHYDLNAMTAAVPELVKYVKPNKQGADSIDFSKPIAVKLLNKAILQHYFNIYYWEFPNKNLCPPIPGRADYIHYIADLLSENNNGTIPTGDKVRCLDIGTGASCIYPIIGVSEYGWQFVASDTNSKSIDSARQIVKANPSLKAKVRCHLQEDSDTFFHELIQTGDKIDVTICNPPFHASAAEAKEASRRKVKNLSGKNVKSITLNFAGIHTELIYPGGEYKFIHDMIVESKIYSRNCLWFSSLVSKESNLKGLYKLLDKVGSKEVKTIEMGTGNKSSRIVAWTFLNSKEQLAW